MHGRINVDDKRLLNATTDVNQLMPLKYKWAWECYLNGSANHWMPTEVPMTKDIEIWRGDLLTPDERRLVMRNLGFFATAESLVANNLTLSVYRLITNPECRQYLLRQALEEAIHTHTFLYVVDSLALNEGEVFNMYHEIPAVSQKDDFCTRHTHHLSDPSFTTKTDRDIEYLLRNLIAFYGILEGVFFYSGFAMILSLKRRNLMPGIGEQFEYILRDETVHLNFGVSLIQSIRQEHPGAWTPRLEREILAMFDEAVELEYAYAKDCLPRGVMGLNEGSFYHYVRHIADRRLERLGFGARYGNENPFAWMSETIDLSKEKNFFETRVTEYQSAGSLKWD